MSLKDLNQTQFNILTVSLARALIRSGTIQSEDLIAEIAQQGVPAEWAFGLVKLIEEMPQRN